MMKTNLISLKIDSIARIKKKVYFTNDALCQTLKMNLLKEIFTLTMLDL